VLKAASLYSAVERRHDGGEIVIRALKPEDREGLIAAVERIGSRSLYRRFFGVKRYFSEREIAFFCDIDFVSHVALVAVAQEERRAMIVGGARYVVVRPTTAEVAFAVIDQWQSKGIGTALMRHLGTIAADAGLSELIATVLPENLPMLSVFQHSGLNCRTRHENGVVEVALTKHDKVKCAEEAP
jgi:GNAT superfamily N-acetyltransferase